VEYKKVCRVAGKGKQLVKSALVYLHKIFFQALGQPAKPA
jgi:hypothetical protein